MTNSQVWFRGVRSSKFRHVYGEPAKRDKCYDNVNVTKNAHDSQFCAVNPKFIAIVTEVAGGGAFVVIPIDCTGRLDFNASKITGHKGPVLDIKWNPFNDNVIASASDDCTIKLWHIPDSGLSYHLTDWIAELQGHKRRVSYIEWHPTAENILFSVGFDHMILVWNVEKGEAINVIDCHPDVIYSLAINRDGSLIATTCKDKKLRIIEPRSGIIKSIGFCHMGSKASKVTFLGTSGRLLTTGFSRHSDRQYAVWDQNDLSKELYSDTVDSSSGVVFPFYDFDTNVVFLAGRGDGNIRYYEVTEEYPYVHFLNQFLSGFPQRGLGVMPKRGLNTSICEIFRFYKLHATKGICEPISMIVPRKSDQFHDDIYPHTASSKPALTAHEWIRGCNSMPILVSMKTGDNIQIQMPKKPKLTSPVIEPPAMNNNKKKFAFLSTETIPDYRPKDLINEKNLKTNTNQTTKFQELQQIFGHVEVSNGENVNTDNDLRSLFKQQAEELRKMKKLLAQKDRKIKELEEVVKKLQNKN
ncbi:coronin-2B-like isoform X2 [Harmonia axyridis]|uniref:coronin-2B-like isoform X2 n=1 Tax=Harmonia axyridis TaxID=115357 RepID=UPI001E27957F|nr:coronin-2B-like isoform X2 [Harmonia axyridis]XP_045480109.1 coronin-2B-like isoform X2 [Harmonia axyridis]XP_045480120.1 coronin-2B-like isoform X2 [Harmonia axyridis]